MNGGHHLKIIQYFKILTLNKREGAFLENQGVPWPLLASPPGSDLDPLDFLEYFTNRFL